MRSNKQIWVLEDDPEAIFVYGEILGVRYDLQVIESLAALETAFDEIAAGTKTPPALLVADLRLPDGLFLDFLSKKGGQPLLNIPFIIVSSYDDLDVLRLCFQEGSADYLTKPFKKSELIVKVERLIQSASKNQPVIATGNNPLEFDPMSLRIRKGNDIVAQLTSKELQIFSTLYRRRGKAIKRKEIETEVWQGIHVSPKALDVHLFNLRRKLQKFDLEIQFASPDGYILSGDRMNTNVPS